MKGYLLLVCFIVPAIGSCTELVCTTTPVIYDPVDHDFGLVGEWESLESVDADAIQIGRDNQLESTYAVEWAGQNPRSSMFVTDRVSGNENAALIQIGPFDDGEKKNYYFAFAVRKDNRLHVWTINRKKLLEHLNDSEITYSTDSGYLTTEIVADSETLLDVFKANASAIANRRAVVYQKKIAR